MRSAGAGFVLLWAAASGASAGELPMRETGEATDRQSSGLRDTAWQVEDIDERGIIDRSMISLAISRDGRVAGSTGCNRYVGHVYLDGDVITVSGIGSTRRACAPALMEQERRFLAALEAASSYAYDAVGRLVIRDGAGGQRLLAVGIASDPTAPADATRPLQR